jgi:thiamine monophosphate kinase
LCNQNAHSFALSGGEDFELLFAVDSRDAKSVSDAVERETGTPITVVGEAVPRDQGVSIRDKGEAWRPLEDAGFKHSL